ncbi:immunity 49 family protein (plasmid) [Pseudoalteromonas piscicida]|uniref:immunity 49 family protein n=1 Tax=Pseudoalteromonas TaxID=53246 RepID=UPI001BA580EC|nr:MULTISPECIES: immunity 49 family protein [Pseudoalteromonas]QUI69090.1 hypothetical protein GSF13_04720 [Pseudoalteromonas sp. M8]UDM63644.1 immunity 49 family protein [Pseudoalteromonas piscicida]
MIKNHYTYAPDTYKRSQELYNKLSDNRVIEGIKNKPHTAISRLYKKNLKTLFIEALEHPNSQNAWKYLVRAQELSLGIFQSNDNPGKPFKLCYDNQLIELNGALDSEEADIFNWPTAMYLAIITRNQDAIDYLIQVDDSVFKAANYAEQFTPFDYALVDLLKSIFTPDADLASAIEKALITSNPDDYKYDEAYHYASRLYWPVVSVILGIFTDDGGVEFNQAIEKATLLHKEFYDTKEEKFEIDGALSIPLIAMAALAKDIKGYDLTTENGYILQWLVNPNPPK